MTILEEMLTEQTTWELKCPNEDYLIVLEDITIDFKGRRNHISPKDGKLLLEMWERNDLLYTHIELTPSAMEKLLVGKDEFFKLEKISILKNNAIKFYFNRIGDIKYSFFTIEKQKRPCFTAMLTHRSGDIIQKSRILVDADYCVHAETIW